MKKYTIEDVKSEAKVDYEKDKSMLSEFFFKKIVELTNRVLELEEELKK